jgi:iron complex outermembrane receptor protein
MRVAIGSMLGAAAWALIAGIAHAQTAEPSGAAATYKDPDALEEIVVTALKRTSDVQMTPAALDVVSDTQIANSNLNNISAIANLAPALNFGIGNGIYTLMTIRGVSSQDLSELGDPAVAFSVDGEYIDRPLNLSAALFDVSRIEVLRGPQGTLYGRNSTAGAVNIITNAPADSFSAGVTGSVGNYSQGGAQGYVNIPLAEWIAVRVSAVYDGHDGYTDTERGRVLDDEDLKAGRIRVLLTPTSALSLLITGETVHNDGGGPNSIGVLVTGAPGTLPNNVLVTPPSRTFAPVGIDPHVNTVENDVRAEVNYDFAWARLTDIVGYRRTSLEQLQNFSGTSEFVLDYLGGAAYQTLGNELRLTNAAGSPVNWQLGYYYFDENQQIDSAVSTALPFAVRDETHTIDFDYPNVNAKSNALFGETTVPLGAGFSATAGVRYTEDKKSRTGTENILDVVPFILSQGRLVNYLPLPADGSVKDSKVTYNAVLDWNWAASNMLYTKVSTGYKSGGFTTVNSYGPESLTAYEVGSKNRFFDDRLQLNADGFYYNYRNQQVQTFVAANGGDAASTVNAASSREYGVEFDAVAAVTKADRLRMSVDYLNTRFNQFTAALTGYGAVNLPVDLAGQPLPYAPTWTLGAGYSHDWTASWGVVRGEVHTAYKTNYYLATGAFRSLQQPGYSDTDASLTYTSPSQMWEVTAYGRNLEDHRVYSGGFFAATPTVPGLFVFQLAAPRTYGLRATVRFQ